MEGRSAALKHADLLLKGGLAKRLRTAREAGVSWNRIARDLWDATDHELDVTGVTVRKWAELLGVDGNGQAAAS